MEATREFTYYDGIIEGRLIENGFNGIGSDMFQCRTKDYLFVITVSAGGKGLATMEMFEFLPVTGEDGMEVVAYVTLCREESFTKHELNGHIDEIISLAKVLIKFYSQSLHKEGQAHE